MVPTFTITIQKVFEIVHELWRDSLVHCHLITTNIVGPDLRIWLKSWITAKYQMIPVHWLRLQTHMKWFPHLL